MDIHRGFGGEIIAPHSGKSFGRLPPTQVCRCRALRYPRQLRGMSTIVCSIRGTHSSLSKQKSTKKR